MTGILQNDNNPDFFLGRYRLEFQGFSAKHMGYFFYCHYVVRWVNKCILRLLWRRENYFSPLFQVRFLYPINRSSALALADEKNGCVCLWRRFQCAKDH